MTAYFNFEKGILERLESRSSRYDVADKKISGLRLRVNTNGSKTYFLLRRIKNAPIRYTIGRYADLTIEQARNEAKKLNSLITLGQNPYQEKISIRREKTFKELFEIYFQDHALRFTKRPYDNLKMLELHIFPVIGNSLLNEITADKIRKLHAALGAQCGEGNSNRVLSIVRAVFNFGIKKGYFVLANPCYGLTKFKQYSRDRFLNKGELKKFFDALACEKTIFQDYFSILLFTGARKSNVLKMKWTDIDFDLKQWRISETETKNKEINIVYLSQACLSILDRRKKTNEKHQVTYPYVFWTDTSRHLVDPKKAFQRIKDRMQIQDVRMHDLRRTFGSYMAISGASLPIIGKALNHKSQESTAIYARLNQGAVVSAINNATNLMTSYESFL